MKFRSLIVAGVAAIGCTAAVPAAQADSCTTATCSAILAGTNAGTLALAVSTPVSAFTSFAPGQDAAASGAILVTSTNGTWHVNVSDLNSGGGHQGHLLASDVSGSCTGSDGFTANASKVTGTGLVGTGITQGAQKTISGTDQVVAEYTNSLLPLPISAQALTTAYALHLNAAEVLRSGCLYTMTSTFTLS
jgi:hypothetical protein